jgi:predicted dithiol-disulfide oxidoreductase (DUF899 family)
MKITHTASREEWRAKRLELLAKEKAASRELAALAEQRRALPAVAIGKDYVFKGPDGKVNLIDLFEGRSQLIVYHFMWLHDVDEGCPSCSFAADNMPNPVHLNEGADTTLALVSRAPYPRLAQFKARMGWRLPWYSSHGSDFNYDFHVSLDAAVAPVEYNYRDADELERAGMGWILEGPSEQPGMSCFLRDGDEVFHTYSTFGRGTEQAGGAYALLDMTALGRQEEWEEPKGRAPLARPAIPDFAV